MLRVNATGDRLNNSVCIGINKQRDRIALLRSNHGANTVQCRAALTVRPSFHYIAGIDNHAILARSHCVLGLLFIA